LHPTRIDIGEDARHGLVELLNRQLADTSDLASQLKQAHWNVKGRDFQQLHELFDEVYAALLPFVDELAERVATLGGTARGTVRMAAQASTLPEYPVGATTGGEHLEALRSRIADYAASTRRAIGAAETLGDPTTADLFTAVSRAVEQQLYFIESHLHGS
ncbi:MAG TPA: DNA starvation/stationary phase protection protein Dps, partial [Trueperaceae bacterium]|nr:DNA starvation/stationary phase protection protein Dps [Trueperaceae bacterium]